MTKQKAAVTPWSREDLERASQKMMKLAGWSTFAICIAYALRFSPAFEAIRTILFGNESMQQALEAKAAWGQFGEFLGGTIGPLVSLLALVCLVSALMLQHEAMMRVQKDAAESRHALADQTRLALDAARLQSLAAALEVTTEMHRQALEVGSVTAIELLQKKENLAGQILEINDRLTAEARSH